jgi:hypothetical protein
MYPESGSSKLLSGSGFDNKLPFAPQMEVCFQNLPLGVLGSRSAPSVLVGALFKKFGLFLNTPRILGLACKQLHLNHTGHKYRH